MDENRMRIRDRLTWILALLSKISRRSRFVQFLRRRLAWAIVKIFKGNLDNPDEKLGFKAEVVDVIYTSEKQVPCCILRLVDRGREFFFPMPLVTHAAIGGYGVNNPVDVVMYSAGPRLIVEIINKDVRVPESHPQGTTMHDFRAWLSEKIEGHNNSGKKATTAPATETQKA